MATKKVKISNYEVELVMNYIKSPAYAFSNEEIAARGSKPRTRVSWIMMRTNKKKLEELFGDIQKERDVIGKKYVEAGKTYKNEEGLDIMKEEFVPEWQADIIELISIVNEIEFELITEEEAEGYNLTEVDLGMIGFLIEGFVDDAAGIVDTEALEKVAGEVVKEETIEA